MSVHAAPAPGDGLALTIGGRAYPVLLPKLRDPRLHLAATITSLQVIGQVGFHFQLSIAQILIALGTTAVLEVAIALQRQAVLLWPASALLTGNGVAFVLRVPGTAHGDWWSTRGWWIFAATAAVALLSKHVLVWRGAHVFNPSNIGLVICFLALGRTRAVPLDFWWGPMSPWLVVALVVIVSGGFAILSRLRLLRVALGFWISFAASLAILAAAGHALAARWHLGPVTGFHLWYVLVTSPEVLVFLFFMITDPKTAPAGPRARLVYAVALGLLAVLLIAPTTSEFAAKVALLGALAIVCVAMPVLRALPRVERRLVYALPVALAAYVGLLVAVTPSAPAEAATATASARDLPAIHVLHSPGVQSQLDEPTARVIATALVQAVPTAGGPIDLSLVPGTDQGPPVAVAQVGGATYRLHETGLGVWSLGSDTAKPQTPPSGPTIAGYRLKNVAGAVGLDFRQGSFRYGVSSDYTAMMGGGVCWIDYNGDGWLDLFAVNSYASADAARWQAHGGLPRTALFENVHGRFRNVSRATHADLAVQGDGCVAGDLNGDGRPDLVVTTTQGVDILWNTGRGTFRTERLRAAGWYAGAAIADVNGDGRPDLFVAGYSDPSEPVPGSLAGFPTNIAGVRDLLYLNEGGGRFREAGVAAGLESADPRHGLGAEFVDANGDGRPDLYVANDEDPNQLYVNVPWPGGAKADPAGLGFRFENRAQALHVADPYAGMGIASDAGTLFVTNSRHEPSAAFAQRGATFANARPDFDRALGTGFAGWGASFVDLENSGKPALVVATGAIPVTSLARDAEPLRVLGRSGGAYENAPGAGDLRVNGRGLAAADADNDGRMEVAVNTIGGKLLLLQAQGRLGHWLDVALSHFTPGAVVTAVLPDGRQLQRTVQAGSSYLSSEDPRVHFGLGAATSVDRLIVWTPAGGIATLRSVRADRVVTVRVPAPRPAPTPGANAPCRAQPARSVARYWDEAAVAALRTSGLSQPVQARDLYDLSTAMLRAQGGGPTAIGYAAYRLLVWRTSFGSNLARTFAYLRSRFCGSVDDTSTTGSSPAALGNRVAAAAIAAGAHDGSLESLHYVDADYTPQNAPLQVAAAGSSIHDATFWQPLARGRHSQTFLDAQWGRVRTALRTLPSAGAPAYGLPSGAVYKRAALAVIRDTSAAHARTRVGASPLAWNLVLDRLPTATLATDLHRLVLLNATLNDTAVAVWRAKRRYQAPRPISMIRYLASTRALPVARGLVERRHGQLVVRRLGRWVPADRWTPPAQTPASPGGASEQSAFSAAASRVLAALTGRSFAGRAAQAGAAALAAGIETPADAAAGQELGRAVAREELAP